MIRKTLRQLREMQRVTGPAITLLMVCLALVAFTSFARAQPQTFEPAVDAEARSPAEVVAEITNLDGPPVLIVTVDAAEDDTYRVYLPGLSMTRATLRYDAEVAQHSVVYPLPARTPTSGRFTLRLVDQNGRHWDFSVKAHEAEPGC